MSRNWPCSEYPSISNHNEEVFCRRVDRNGERYARDERAHKRIVRSIARSSIVCSTTPDRFT
eukprot:scaffold316215_cov44-Attheya_sp.AAC.1